MQTSTIPMLDSLLPRLLGQWPLLLFSVWQPHLDVEANEIEIVTWQRELKARDRSNMLLLGTGRFPQWLLAVGFDETEATLERLGRRLVFGLPPGTPPGMALLPREGAPHLFSRNGPQLLPGNLPADVGTNMPAELPALLSALATALAGEQSTLTHVASTHSPYGPAVARSLGQIG